MVLRASGATMRYFLDTEFNGFCGDLISIALVPEDAGLPPFYEAVSIEDPTPWVRYNALPVLETRPRSRKEVIDLFAAYLMDDPAPLLVADWPEDIALAAAHHRAGLYEAGAQPAVRTRRSRHHRSDGAERGPAQRAARRGRLAGDDAGVGSADGALALSRGWARNGRPCRTYRRETPVAPS